MDSQFRVSEMSEHYIPKVLVEEKEVAELTTVHKIHLKIAIRNQS